ncbi:PadR family transcriptional regulator [Alteromonas gracilis]
MSRRGATLDLAILGLLHESDLHGYELRKRLNLLFGWGRVLSYGSLYPALKKLLRAGLISEHDAEVGRRRKIVYSLTEAGRERFAEEVTDVGPTAWEDESFGIRFAFFARTEAGVRLRILEGRRARLQERLDRVRSGGGFTLSSDTYAAELRRHSIESVERELAWLTTLIDDERRAEQAAEQSEDPQGSPSQPNPSGGNQS